MKSEKRKKMIECAKSPLNTQSQKPDCRHPARTDTYSINCKLITLPRSHTTRTPAHHETGEKAKYVAMKWPREKLDLEGKRII